MLTVSWRTHVGAVRTLNEDVVLWDPALALVALADGMGGHNAGEVASKLAIESLQSFLKQTLADECTWPFGIDPSMSFAANRLMNAVKIANRHVYRTAEHHPEYNGMGTTVVAALADGPHVTFACVGDSRIYLWNGAALRQLRDDDSWLVLMQRESGLSAASFAQHPLRHALTNVVGAHADVDMTVDNVVLEDGESIMMCSDGLHGALPDAKMVSILQAQPDLDRAADALVHTAIDADGGDNISVLIARYTA
jgi:protein phosphatase